MLAIGVGVRSLLICSSAPLFLAKKPSPGFAEIISSLSVTPPVVTGTRNDSPVKMPVKKRNARSKEMIVLYKSFPRYTHWGPIKQLNFRLVRHIFQELYGYYFILRIIFVKNIGVQFLENLYVIHYASFIFLLKKTRSIK